MTKQQRDICRSVLRSIKVAVRAEPPRDWRESLADGADALADMVEDDMLAGTQREAKP